MKGALFRCSLLGMLAVSFIAEAQAQRRCGTRGGPRCAPGHAEDSVVHRVQRNLRTGDRINLARAAVQARGKDVRSLTVVGTSARGRGMIQLINYRGHILGSANLGIGLTRATIHVPARANLRNLFLEARGNLNVQQIKLQLAGHFGGGVDVLRAVINRQTQGVTNIPVKAAVHRQTGINLRGKRIQSVIFRAQAMPYSRRSQIAQVLVDGHPVGRAIYLNSYMQRHEVNLRGMVRPNSRIQLEVTGRATVRMVGLRINQSIRPEPRPRPRPRPRTMPRRGRGI